MNTVKKNLVLTAAVAVLPVCAMAQHFGVGINNPTATLQVHSYTQIEDFPFPWVPNPTGGRNEGDTINRDDPPSFEHYLTTFHMTNSNTGTDTSDGLLVRQHDLDVAIVQQEMGTLWVKNHYAQLELTSYGFGVGPCPGWIQVQCRRTIKVHARSDNAVVAQCNRWCDSRSPQGVSRSRLTN